MAKRQSKSGAKKRRKKKYKGPRDAMPSDGGSGGEDYGSSGAMGGMVTGFRRAIGVEKKKKKTWVDYTWTILLLLAIGGILFWRFGRG
ncbi:MAG TPA: hypothetical protein RMH85_00130 [Polyangiaceae bacterium LLY-WYZ-15_(1-7)]|nr:hypothetical protein [Myxococcales bacterium]MAT27090.1 hypothetical protein [Sandaracinus sp.]HJL00313.1 hypothetical protein [Polyangiaceae bacterium LLY-WYZ-15_(1-7)]MBJ73200.1 hypothetical protein [Sandaracinus sp.]HJL06865.1 hypothetical protein [Polyangiaceae bacterium LLY-WYZ-15_(1-7)]